MAHCFKSLYRPWTIVYRFVNDTYIRELCRRLCAFSWSMEKTLVSSEISDQIWSISEASVFLLFNRKPKTSLKKSNICKEVVREAGDPSKIKVVSSAYWLIFTSSSFIFMPLMFLFCRIVTASISTQRIKKYGERGKPCLTPLSGLKKLLDQPLLRMQLSVLW